MMNTPYKLQYIYTDNNGCSTDEECGFAFKCDKSSGLCVRDCDSFHIEEYLQCSSSYLDVEYQLIQINQAIDIIDKNITNISREIDVLDERSGSNSGAIDVINDDITDLQRKWNDTCDKIERFGVNYPVPHSVQSGVNGININSFNITNRNNINPVFKTKDILIIGVLLINMMIGIYNCIYKDDKYAKGEYKSVMYETSDMDILSEQQVLK